MVVEKLNNLEDDLTCVKKSSRGIVRRYDADGVGLRVLVDVTTPQETPHQVVQVLYFVLRSKNAEARLRTQRLSISNRNCSG